MIPCLLMDLRRWKLIASWKRKARAKEKVSTRASQSHGETPFLSAAKDLVEAKAEALVVVKEMANRKERKDRRAKERRRAVKVRRWTKINAEYVTGLVTGQAIVLRECNR